MWRKNLGRVVKGKLGKNSDKKKRTKVGQNIEANVKEILKNPKCIWEKT